MKNKPLSPHEIKHLQSTLCERTDYFIHQRTLVAQIFTRRSYTARNGGECNEILEFIGDTVLNSNVVKIIAKGYGSLNRDYEYVFKIRENHFSGLKNEFVNNHTLASIIDEWDIVKYLVVGKCDTDNHIDEQEKVKADLFEAILGAIAISSNWDNAVLENAVSKMLSLPERLKAISGEDFRHPNFNMDNSVSTLKELAEKGLCSPPIYEFCEDGTFGNDENGNAIWSCSCRITEWGLSRLVFGLSKKTTKKAAAYLILCQQYNLKNEYGHDSFEVIWELFDNKLEPESRNHHYFKRFLGGE